jgi:hypothetical protein
MWQLTCPEANALDNQNRHEGGSNSGATQTRLPEGRLSAAVTAAAFPLGTKLKRSSSSDGIQPPVVSSQDFWRPAQAFQGAGHEADGDTAMTHPSQRRCADFAAFGFDKLDSRK